MKSQVITFFYSHLSRHWSLEATRHIRGMTREDARRIPIFALSANAFADDIQRSLQCGMNTHFNKPVDMDSICAALHYWLEHDKGNRP